MKLKQKIYKVLLIILGCLSFLFLVIYGNFGGEYVLSQTHPALSYFIIVGDIVLIGFLFTKATKKVELPVINTIEELEEYYNSKNQK